MSQKIQKYTGAKMLQGFVFVLAGCLLSFSLNAAWSLDEGTMVLSDDASGWSFKVSGTVPDQLTLSKVNETNAITTTDVDLSALDGVRSPWTLVTLADLVFNHNPVVTSIRFPDTLSTILGGNPYNSAIHTCANLTNVVALGVTNIGYCSMRQNPNLVTVALSENVESFGGYAFYDNKKMTGDYKFPKLTKLDGYVFQNTKVTSLEIPNVVNFAGIGATPNSGSITNIVINWDRVENIGGQAFAKTMPTPLDITFSSLTNCGVYGLCITPLKSVNLPLLKIYHQSIFSGCKNLTNAVIPNARILYGFAFNGTSKLKEIKLPWCLARVYASAAPNTTYGNSCFGSSGITNFFIHTASLLNEESIGSIRAARTEAQAKFTYYGGAETNEETKVTWIWDDLLPDGTLSATSVTLAGATNMINNVALSGNVEIPEQLNGMRVTAIEAGAFMDYPGITRIKAPKYAVAFGTRAFPRNCRIKVSNKASSDVIEALKAEYGEEWVTVYSADGLRIIVR